MNATDSQLDSSIFNDFEGISSVYEFRRRVELDVNGHAIRIELWYWHSNPKCPWEARLYRRNEGAEHWQRWTGLLSLGEKYHFIQFAGLD